MNRRNVVILSLFAALVASPALGQDLSVYRGVHLGDAVQAVLKITGASPTGIKVVYERPVLMQDLEWRVRSIAGSSITNDPVQRVVFSFSNDQLYRIFVTYERARIDGLTDADLVESLSATYGTAITSDAAKVLRPSENPSIGEQYRVVARWEDANHSIVLVRGGYLVPLSLVMLSTDLAEDARYTAQEADRLSLAERPAREALKAQQDADAQRLAQEKLRPVNKAAFKP